MRKFILFAAIIALLASMSTTVLAAPPPDGPLGLERAIAAQEAHTNRLLNIPGVVGTAVGLGDDGLAAVKIYTEKAGVAGLPKNLDGIPVEVAVTGRFTVREDPTAKYPRPVPIGVSTGHPDITAGTIGARVTDGTYVYALSNNHVYANSNEASIGDSALQPGPYDGGTDPEDMIGTLFDFEPINFNGGENTMDAAIARSTTSELGNATPSDGYGIPGSFPVDAYVGQLVQKYGRTTGLTQGQVSEINVIVDVCYEARGPFRCVKSARFVDQIAISDGLFSDGGDSGSLIVTDNTDKNPVGLLFAGSSTRTIANPIGPVLARFNVSIDSEPADAPPSVNIVSPTEDSTVSGTIPVQISATDEEDAAGTLTVEWNVDGGSWMPTTYNSGAGYYEASWDTTGVADGSHRVNARVTDSAINVSIDYNDVLVDNVNDPPVASFTYTSNGLTCEFNASGSYDPDGNIVAYEWDFGDGDTDTESGVTVSHTYAAEGTYTVILTVTDDDSATDSDSQDVTVIEATNTMNVVDLDGAKDIKGKSGQWKVFVTVTIYDENDNPVGDATVTGIWSGATSGTVQGTTGSDGTVTFGTGNMKGGDSVTFSVDGITHDTFSYDYKANSDPDGDSDGTTITVSK